MDEYESLSPSKRECKYHVIFSGTDFPGTSGVDGLGVYPDQLTSFHQFSMTALEKLREPVYVDAEFDGMK